MKEPIFFFRRLQSLLCNTSILEVLASLPKTTKQCQLKHGEAQNGISSHCSRSKPYTLGENFEALDGQTRFDR